MFKFTTFANGMEKRWVIKSAAAEVVEQLHKELKINPTLCSLLVQRGIHSYTQAKEFFRPRLENLHDPFLIKDMDKAIARLEQAMASDERIMIYGDYDVDGTTAVALVYGFINQIYKNIEYYIPDRYDEGYGISNKGIEHAASKGVKLIIALDCGIKANDKVDYAKEKGIDFIICDHHRPGDELPAAYAILDPKRDDCTYPYDELSGCGIGFKLLQGFCQSNNLPPQYLFDSLDLVCISIASDIVPITNENRVMAYYGLKRINENPRPGIKSLIETAGLDRELTIQDIIFVIGPRINAAGRLEHGKEAVRLLLSKEDTAPLNAHILEKKNIARRLIDGDITREALEMIESSEELKKRKSTVLFQPHWHKGVIGIVAARLIETYYRPTIILTGDGDMASGSARSIPGFDVYNAILECSDLLEQFGGHKYAAGLTIKVDKIEAFKERFEDVVKASIHEELLIPEIEIDAELKLEELTDSFYNILEQFAPFGPGNLRPVFVTKGLKDTGKSALVGADKNHLKIQMGQQGSTSFEGIGFNQGEKLDIIKTGLFDVCYTLDINEWNGNRKLQLQVKDVKS